MNCFSFNLCRSSPYQRYHQCFWCCHVYEVGPTHRGSDQRPALPGWTVMLHWVSIWWWPTLWERIQARHPHHIWYYIGVASREEVSCACDGFKKWREISTNLCCGYNRQWRCVCVCCVYVCVCVCVCVYVCVCVFVCVYLFNITYHMGSQDHTEYGVQLGKLYSICCMLCVMFAYVRGLVTLKFVTFFRLFLSFHHQYHLHPHSCQSLLPAAPAYPSLPKVASMHPLLYMWGSTEVYKCSTTPSSPV